MRATPYRMANEKYLNHVFITLYKCVYMYFCAVLKTASV